jgi:trigger factor
MSIQATDLQIAVEEGERWRRTVSVTVPANVVQAERGKIAERLSKRLKLPGFRKGKIPSHVIEQRFGPSLDQEMIDKVIGEAYKQALAHSELSPISEGEVKELRYEPRQDLHFSISFDVQPEFELARVGGFKVERPEAVVEEEQVSRVLERLREQNGAWKPVEEGKPANGDLVAVTLEKIEDGVEREAQPYEFILGQGDAIPDVEEAIQTLEIGETGDFVVRFPDDFPNEERRGDEEQLRIEVLGRRVLELPELDDEFAKGLGDFENLDDLETKVREDLTREANERADGAVRGQLLDQVVSANPFTVPVSMVDRYLDSLLGNPEGVSEEEMSDARERIGPEAERAVKRILVIERLADTQGLRATEDEIDARVEEIAERSGESPAQVYAKLQKADRIEALEREITEKKVFDFLTEQSEITEN